MALLPGIPTRPLGSTGWQSTILALGGVRYHKLPEPQGVRIVGRALELGINHIDTARSYGESEVIVGKAIRGRRQQVFLATKTRERSYDAARREIEESLGRLGTDAIDMLFMHNVQTEDDLKGMLAPKGSVKAAEEFKRSGHIRFIGVSGHYFPGVMSKALDEYPFDGILCPLGALNAVADSFEEKVLKKARRKGVAVMGMKVLASGLARREQVAPFLRYAFGLDLDTAVVGADSVEQVEENARTAAEYARLSQAERNAALEGARMLLKAVRPQAFWLGEHYGKK